MRFLILLIIFISVYANAGDTDKAIRKAAEAFSKTKTGKYYIKKVESRAIQYIPVSKKTATIIGTTTFTLINGKIDTKIIKNMDVKAFGGKIRPDLEYDFRKGEASGAIKANWEF